MINKASNWVKYCMSQIPCKKGAIALDLACGHGRNSILLAKYNCKVISIDIDILSLKSFNRKNIIKVQTDIENFLNWPLNKDIFDLVIVTNFLNRKIFTNIKSSIKNDGYLIYETFGQGQQFLGKPKNRKFLLKKNELLSLTKDLKLIFYEEVKVISGETKFIKNRILCQNAR